MKIIFSRKGFDSAAGGCPSPILNGRPLSMPIPTRMPTPTCFADLAGLYGRLVGDLTRGRWTAADACHLDPDIDPSCLPRKTGWRGALGQTSAAQAHLANQGVQPGDLFVFWGLFRPVARDGRWKFAGEPEHRIWGWLQIGEIVDLGDNGAHAIKARPWLHAHPHARAGWSTPNTLYIAADRLSLALQLPGAGILKTGRRLTAPGATPSRWRVPDWLNPARGGCGMTYHRPHRWSTDGTLQSAARGQEFVAVPSRRAEAARWLLAVLQDKPA